MRKVRAPKRRGRKPRHIDWSVEPWATFAFHHNTGPQDFRALRKALGFTQRMCADFLGVHEDSIRHWEGGKGGNHPIPRAAVCALAMLAGDSRFLTVTHRDWDGWFIGRDGKLYTPDRCYWFTPNNLRAWWIEQQIARSARETAKDLQQQLDAAIKENTELRSLFVQAGVVTELDSMERRIGELRERINTAQVIPFPKPPSSEEAA